MTAHRRFVARILAGLAAASLVVIVTTRLSALPSTETASKRHGTIGLLVTSLTTAMYETPNMDECPKGLAIGNDEIWWRLLSPVDRERLTDGGLIEPLNAGRRQMTAVRGPGGLDVCWNPTSVKDPPLRTVEGKISYGMNLDGTTDGRATANSCKHEKFTRPDGEPGIDNQMYRILGCIHGWRSDGYIETTADGERKDFSQGNILIEITGVTDERNSGHVRVAFYRARDVVRKDAAGSFLPYASYRLDESHYGQTAHGRIVNGVLTIDPTSVDLPYYGNQAWAQIHLRDMRLELKLLPDGGAEGLIAGYYEFRDWWDYLRKISHNTANAQWSCPATYEAARRLADGYPDPETGECTAISTAFHVKALPAFVIHAESRIAEAVQP